MNASSVTRIQRGSLSFSRRTQVGPIASLTPERPTLEPLEFIRAAAEQRDDFLLSSVHGACPFAPFQASPVLCILPPTHVILPSRPQN